MTDSNSPGTRRRRSTIEDVAAAAGVSVATVSRAIRGLPNVAISTRQRVVEVAESLGYSANPAATRLAAGRTRTVTVVIPHLSGWYFSTVVAGVEAVCSDAGYDVLVVGVGSQSDLSRLLSEQYHLERRTDGLVAVDIVVSPDEAASITERGLALTNIGSKTSGYPSVRIDNVRVGRLAAEHLLSHGHHRVGVIGAQKDNPMSFDVPQLRYTGFVDALTAHDVEFNTDMLAGGNFGVDGGQEAMASLLDLAQPPTAVFSMSDEMAFGALMELGERNLVAGRDVSIIGVDDHEFSRVVDLTTIHQPVADHGATAARLLLNELEAETRHGVDHDPHGEQHPIPDVIAPIRLVDRTTTGPVAVSSTAR